VLLPVDMEVDPGAEYDIYPEALGTGEVTLVSWTERDLA
jgi:hypothetical protein